MSAQQLSPRSVRRIERVIGEPILRAWAHGSYRFDIVTPDHRHGVYDMKTSTVEWGEPRFHYSTCAETWPT